MIDLIKVVILGIVEGITEFLPISSTGHLIVASALLDFQTALEGTFELFIQIGAVVAVALFYRHELWRQISTVHKDRKIQGFWLAVIVAGVPASLVGFLLRDTIKEMLFNPLTVAITLIIGGIVFIIVENRPSITQNNRTHALTDISLRQAMIIGIAQAFALIPGVSRSGASIIGGLVGGLDRPTATAFSFFLSIPILGGATIIDLLLNLDKVQSGDWINLILGAVVSGIVAWFAISWLLRYVARNNFIPFGIYRIIAGIVILILIALNAIPATLS